MRRRKMIHTTPILSSMIAEIGHDNETRTLRVKFKKGEIWEYSDVPPEEFEQLKKAESVGSHFHKNIRNKYAGKRVML
jgi:hypothetical protein